MPKLGHAKTKSERKVAGTTPAPPNRTAVPGFITRLIGAKRRLFFAVCLVCLAVLALLAPVLFYQPPYAEWQVRGQTIKLEIASTAAAQQKGLSGRKSLLADKGMLFVFAKPVQACMWMKGMRFPLDIVWLSADKQVEQVRQNVLPATYPKSFCGASPPKYVVELGAGQTQRLGVHTGQTLTF